jgi:hypothetical protein
VHLVLLAVAGAALTVAVRGQWFFGDEWAFIQDRDLGEGAVAALLEPHNEHLSVLPVLVYRLLLSAFGLHTYWPYLAVMLGLHLLLSHLLWRVLLRAGARGVTATSLALLFALLGSGGENLLWAFQMGFVGSLAAGFGALLLVDHPGRLGRRDVAAVLLCLAALGCSGVGVAVVATVALAVLLRRRNWWQAAAVTAVPAAAYLAWYLAFGRGVSGAPDAPPLPPLGLGAVPRFAFDGLANAAEAATGLRGAGAVLVLSLLVLLVRRPALVSGPSSLAVACAGGAVAFFVLTGISRVALGVEQARVSRYVYVGALLLLPLAALGLDVLLERLRRPSIVVVPLVACLVAVNVAVLYSAADRTRVREQSIRGTILASAELVRGGTRLLADEPDPDFSADLTVAGLRDFLDRGWLPEPGAIAPLDAATARARLLVDLVDPVPSRGFRLDSGVRALLEQGDDGCVRVRPVGEQPQVAATVLGGGGALLVRPEVGGVLSLRLTSPQGPPSGAREMDLEGGVERSLRMTTGGSVLLTLPQDGITELCT